MTEIKELGVRVDYIVNVADAKEHQPTVLIDISGFVATAHELVGLGVGRRPRVEQIQWLARAASNGLNELFVLG